MLNIIENQSRHANKCHYFKYTFMNNSLNDHSTLKMMIAVKIAVVLMEREDLIIKVSCLNIIRLAAGLTQ